MLPSSQRDNHCPIHRILSDVGFKIYSYRMRDNLMTTTLSEISGRVFVNSQSKFHSNFHCGTYFGNLRFLASTVIFIEKLLNNSSKYGIIYLILSYERTIMDGWHYYFYTKRQYPAFFASLCGIYS